MGHISFCIYLIQLKYHSYSIFYNNRRSIQMWKVGTKNNNDNEKQNHDYENKTKRDVPDDKLHKQTKG